MFLSTKVLIALALIVVIVLRAIAYMVYGLHQGARRTTVLAAVSPPYPLVGKLLQTAGEGEGEDEEVSGPFEGGEREFDLVAIPPAVLAAHDLYIISRERVVSEAVPLGRLFPGLRVGLGSQGRREAIGGSVGSGRGLLETYLSTTMRAFTWTPQAFIMKSIIARLPDGVKHAATFSMQYLDACCFKAGDRVCGVYVVRERISWSKPRSRTSGERVLLDLCPPHGWSGPLVHGVLDCGFVLEEEKESDDERFVRFVNETVLWRQRDEKATLLEGRVGRWLHTLMVGWVVMRGVEAVTQNDEKSKVA
jgi:hypothetical protein